MAISIAGADLASPEAQALLGQLDAYLSSLYEPEDNFLELDPAEVDGTSGVFLLARDDKAAVGCVALRLLGDGAGELKRLYVAPAARGRGLGRRLVAAAEAWAAAAGCRRVVLETGGDQAEAVGLYERTGYRRIDCFGPYAHAPLSICYEKPLA